MMAWPASTGWRSNLHRGRNCKKSADRCRRDLNPDTGPLLQGGRALPAYAYSSSQRKISVTQDSYDPHRSKHRRRPAYEALAAAFGADYTLYCLPWAVQEQLTALREHLDKVSGPLEQRRATAWLGSTDTLSLCTTLAGQLNSGRISLACLPGSPSLPETLSAAYRAVAASEEDPARPLNTLVLTGVAVPPESSRLSRTEQEAALKNGVTPLEVGPGEVVQIVRAISTYTRNAAGATDISLLDMTTIRTLDYVARTVKERIDLRFPREKLSTRTPPKVRSEVLDVLRQLEQLESVEEVEASAAGVICERDLQDPTARTAASRPTWSTACTSLRASSTCGCYILEVIS